MAQKQVDVRTKELPMMGLKELEEFINGKSFTDWLLADNSSSPQNPGGRLVSRRRRQSQNVRDQECQAELEDVGPNNLVNFKKALDAVFPEGPKVTKNTPAAEPSQSRPYWRPFQGKRMSTEDSAAWLKGIQESDQKMRELMVKNQEREERLKDKQQGHKAMPVLEPIRNLLDAVLQFSQVSGHE